jgi:anti-sigma B factor antagonist
VSSATDPNAQTWGFTSGAAPGTASLVGEIDFSVTTKVRERLMRLIEAKVPEIQLDLSGLEYIDSSGLALLIEARKILLEAKRSLRIVAISPQVRKLFNLTQLGELFGLPD